MQSETGFPCSHQLKSYVVSKSRLKLATRAVLSADAGLLVRVVASDLSKVAIFKLPHLHLEPPLGVTSFEFDIFGIRKLESLGYSAALFA